MANGVLEFSTNPKERIGETQKQDHFEARGGYSSLISLPISCIPWNWNLNPEMEHSLLSLVFTGSIPEAITEAKSQKKLFVVYVSGENEASVHLEKSIWADSQVAKCITKYCTLLHILEGTNDATNFSAILYTDPQKSSPCITAVGYNGVLLCQNEGLISSEDLISSIEKAWLSLHIQETTAAVLTTALSSTRNDQSLDGASAPTSVVYENEDCLNHRSSAPSEEHANASGSGQSAASENLVKEEDDEHIVQVTEDSLKPEDLKTACIAQSALPGEDAVRELNRGPTAIAQDSHEVSEASGLEMGCSTRVDTSSSDTNTQCSNGPSRLINPEIERNLERKSSLVEEHRYSSIAASDDMSMERLLNIRLPSGVNLQDRFLKTDELRLVKDYVDRNLTDFNGTYNLAIPYPRKVFEDPDLDRSLAELGIINRQGLIVVPCQRTLHNTVRGSSSSSPPKFAASADTDSTTGRAGGYFNYVRRMLSYVNPFSYVGGTGTSASAEELTTGVWQRGPNPAIQNVSTSKNDEESVRRRRLSHFGSNIHTLRREDDDANDDRNTYWNGNSTQFGGNDGDK